MNISLLFSLLSHRHPSWRNCPQFSHKLHTCVIHETSTNETRRKRAEMHLIALAVWELNSVSTFLSARKFRRIFRRIVRPRCPGTGPLGNRGSLLFRVCKKRPIVSRWRSCRFIRWLCAICARKVAVSKTFQMFILRYRFVSHKLCGIWIFSSLYLIKMYVSEVSLFPRNKFGWKCWIRWQIPSSNCVVNQTFNRQFIRLWNFFVCSAKFHNFFLVLCLTCNKRIYGTFVDSL